MDSSDSARSAEDFEKTALPHLDACFRLAVRLTGNKEDAEDLVQEAYLRAYRFFHRFEPGTNFKAWIFKVLFNIFLNESRKRSNKNETVASPNLEFLSERMAIKQGHQRSNDPERAAIKSQMVEVLQKALKGLPEEFRVVVHLADVEGCNYKEIASIVGCPMGTVMSRLHRGRRLLREVMLHRQNEQTERNVSQEGRPIDNRFNRQRLP
jgi:RNA polymerase sigma-70 factor (ECF subfamily)